MALKRKRSSITSSSSASSSDAGSTCYSAPSPLSSIFYAQSKPSNIPYSKNDSFHGGNEEYSSSCHLNSRTRKRYRDNRPDEQAIFATTISKLYDAQRRLPDATSIPSPQVQMTPEPSQPTQRSTLHSFWKVNTPMCAPPSILGEPLGVPGTSCEDCDVPLRDEGAMDLDESVMANELACRYCSRMVCNGCALVRESRSCLSCATHGYS
ncbi:uncharacterized protein K489DRAFT_316840 [Dissoconium aciculare CBS 342.82]|uniref:Uncharacterized protein n=1 Tax=Dissoconium aciculare CBS 342.82 TaxID=1314786 RepID=A0A6J3M912_9PEZI|nr:uncharacterized protein K489DRAFT_316840 [Dissoconium aciculare CBS 342.82]KAF1824495.1 hypothetical protein K489DRAFT_316840 [Dissoconium aciculare CBS 342.82]